MASSSSNRTHAPGPDGRRPAPWTITSIVLALFGLLAVAPVVGDTAGARASLAVVAAAAGESGILPAPGRISGLEPAKRRLVLDDGDDSPQHPAAAVPLRPLPRWSAAGPAFARTDAETVGRPLRGRPQSPRAPPSLA